MVVLRRMASWKVETANPTVLEYRELRVVSPCIAHIASGDRRKKEEKKRERERETPLRPSD